MARQRNVACYNLVRYQPLPVETLRTSLAPADDPCPTTRMVRWIGLSISALLLTACIAGIGWFLFPVLFPQLWANYLTRVQRQAQGMAALGHWPAVCSMICDDQAGAFS